MGDSEVPTEKWRRGYPRAEQGAYFEGDGFVSLGEAPLPSPPMTVAFWTRWSYAEPADDFGPSAPTPRTATFFSYGETDDGEGSATSWRIADASNLTLYLTGASLRTDVAVDDERWHHVAFTIAAEDDTHFDVTCYHNGDRVARRSLPHDQGLEPGPGGPFTVAQRFPGNDGDSFSGQIIYLAVFDRVLDREEVGHLMHKSAVPDAVVFWPLSALPLKPIRTRNVNFERPTNIDLPEPGEHVVRVDTSRIGRTAQIREEGSELGELLGPGEYTIDIDDFGVIHMTIDEAAVRLNGAEWRALEEVVIQVQENGDFWTNEPRAEGRVAVSAVIPATIDAADVGITSRSVLVEDHPHDAEGNYDFDTTHHAYRTTINFSHPVAWADLNADPAARVSIDGEFHDLAPVGHGAKRIPLEGIVHLSLSIPADAVGTSKLHVRTSEMPEDSRVTICPDVDLHRKIDALPPTAIADARSSPELGIPNADPDSCAAVQGALQNISRTVEHTYREAHGRTCHDRRVNPRRMSDTHWMLEKQPGGGHVYRAIAADEVLGHIKNAVRIDQGAEQAGLFEQIGEAFEKAGKVIVHTAGKVVHDVATTGESIMNDVTRTAERVGDDLVHGDLSGSFEDLAHGVVDIAEDAGRGVASLAGDVAQGAEEMVVVTIHLAEQLADDVGEVVQFVLDHTGKLGEAIKGVLHAIELAVDRFIGWLADALGWDDIIRTQRALSERILHGIDQFGAEVDSHLLTFRNGLETMRNQLDGSIDQTIASIGPSPGEWLGAPPTADKHSAGSERSEWMAGKMQGSGATVVEIPPITSPIVADLVTLLDGAAGDPRLARRMELIWSDLEAFSKDPLRSGDFLVGALLEFVAAVIDVLVDLAEAAIDLLRRAVAMIVEVLRGVLTYELEIPFLTPLFAAITTSDELPEGESLNLLNLTALLIAVPTTLVHKAIGLGEPYPAVGSAGQSDTASGGDAAVTDLVVYGSAQLFDGILSMILDAQFDAMIVTEDMFGEDLDRMRRGAEGPSYDYQLASGTRLEWTARDPTAWVNVAGIVSCVTQLTAQLVSRPTSPPGSLSQLTWGYQWVQFALDTAATLVPLGATALEKMGPGGLDPGSTRISPLRYIAPPAGLLVNCALEAGHMALFVAQFIDEQGDTSAGAELLRSTYFIDPIKGLVETLLVTEIPEAKAIVLGVDGVAQTAYAVLCWVAAGQKAA